MIIYVALYLRCSTDMQDMSVEDQQKVLITYCESKGYVIVTEFVDEGKSGTTFEGRPDAMRLFQMVQSGLHTFSRVIILNESRFGRVPNTKEPFYYEFLLERSGVTVEYAQSESNMPGAPGVIMRAIKYEQAAQFSKQLSLDVIRGHKTAVGKGYSTGGFPPLGYARMVCDESGKELFVLEPGSRKGVKEHWVKWVMGDPRDVALVMRIFTLYAEGNKGLKALARVLNDEKIPSPKGGLWGIDALRAILVNRTYVGERRYGGTKWSKKVKEVTVCLNAHVPIISLALFDKVQAQMKSREFGGCNVMRTPYLLSGKITCMSCAHKFQGRSVKNGVGTVYKYYVDSGYTSYQACESLNIPIHSRGNLIGIEDFVIDAILRMLDTDRYVERFKEHLKNMLIALERDTKSGYPILKKKLNAIDAEITKTQDALIFTGNRSESLADRLVEAEKAREELVKEIKKYEVLKNQPSKVLLLVNEYTKELQNVGNIIRSRTPGEQKTAIGYFLDRIEVLREEGIARCYFYDSPRPREIDYILPGVEPGSCVCQVGAEGGTRTPTGLLPLRPERSASTSSTTSARV